MSTIVIDGLNEEDFRRSIENRLREGMAVAAIERLRPLLAPYAGPGGILPERFLTIEAKDLVLSGWDDLREAVRRHDLPGRRVSALSITFAWPGEDAPEPDEDGRLQPCIETSYYSDNAYPFSQSTRNDLLEGYSFYGCSWSGDCEASDRSLLLLGIDDLHGALAQLEARLLTCEEPDEDSVRAGSLGACLLSALLVQSIAERIARDGLPRPLCVMAGSSGVYPYFDAPVVGMPDRSEKFSAERDGFNEPTVQAIYGASIEVPTPRYSSLLMTSIPKARKRAVLVLDHDDDEVADRLARLRHLTHPEVDDGEQWHDDMPDAPEPDRLRAAASDTPLLARKPAKKPPDFRDMLSPCAVEPLAGASPPRENAEPDELTAPAMSLTPTEPLLGPGFTLLEPDLQQRLQDLLAGKRLPTVQTHWPEPVLPAGQPALRLPEKSGQPEEPGVAISKVEEPARPIWQALRPGAHARMAQWLRGKAAALRTRFSS